MISHERKFILITPPKTGSTSIISTLLEYASVKNILNQENLNSMDFFENDEDIIESEWLNFYNGGQKQNWHSPENPRKHAPLLSYKKNHIINYNIIVTIRNPYDRIISLWKWEQAVKGVQVLTRWNEELRRNYIEEINYIKLNFKDYLINHTWDWYYKPQVDFLYSDFIDIKNIQLIRLESLQQDFDIVCDKLQIPHKQLPHANKSEHKHYTEYYDDETRQIVAEKYAKDIECFGYKFGQ